MIDVITALRDLKEQATKERSHYYVAAVADQAIREIQRLRRSVQRGEFLGIEVMVSDSIPPSEVHFVSLDGTRHVLKVKEDE